MSISKLVCLGDSITWGFPFGPNSSWVGLSAKDLGINIVNSGINGDTGHDLLVRLDRDVFLHNPSHVIFMVGTNDASINVSLESYQDTIMKLHAILIGRGIAPIIGMPIPAMDKWLEYTLEKYRIWLTSFCRENHAVLIDFSEAFLTLEGAIKHECFSDEVHPSRLGYQRMANVFTDFMKRFAGFF